MIKRFFIVFAVVFLLMPALTARADVVYGNEFLSRHSNKTEPLNCSFYVHGVDGYVSAKKAPNSKAEVYKYENGITIRIAATYKHNGKYWGVTPGGHGPAPVWVPMDQLLTCYSYTDFEIENKDKLYDFTGSFDALRASEEFYVWQWPGSDQDKIHYFTDNSDIKDVHALRAKYAYMDDTGREWVYIIIWQGYGGGLSHFGSAEGWICISDPKNSEIPAFYPAPEPRKWSPENSSENEYPSPLLMVSLAAVVVIGTFILTRIFWKPNKIGRGKQ